MYPFRRILLLLLTVFQILFNYLADHWLGVSIVTVTDRYRSSFVPAGYAFSIWGLIYLAQLVYAVIQILPASKDKRIYDILAIPLMISYLGSIAWGIAFRLEYIPLSFICLFTMLVAALIVYNKAFQAVETDRGPGWLPLPFSLYAGWLSVANIAGFSLWLVYSGYAPGGIGVMMMIALAILAGLAVLFSFDDHIYPLVISWAAIALWVRQQELSGWVALIGGLVLLAVNGSWWLMRKRRRAVLNS